MVRSQPRQIVHETVSKKIPSQKRAGEVAQDVDPEFKPSTTQTQKEKCRILFIFFGDRVFRLATNCQSSYLRSLLRAGTTGIATMPGKKSILMMRNTYGHPWASK
jgi:hypothetical protein